MIIEQDRRSPENQSIALSRRGALSRSRALLSALGRLIITPEDPNKDYVEGFSFNRKEPIPPTRKEATNK